MNKKLTTVLLIMCLVFALSLNVFADGVESETNNTLATADSLSSSFLLQEDLYVFGVCSEDDTQDWYKIKSTNPIIVDFRLFLDSVIDLDLYLYDSNGQLIISSTEFTGDNEIINSRSLSSEYLYLKVEYVEGPVRTPYFLIVENAYDPYAE